MQNPAETINADCRFRTCRACRFCAQVNYEEKREHFSRTNKPPLFQANDSLPLTSPEHQPPSRLNFMQANNNSPA